MAVLTGVALVLAIATAVVHWPSPEPLPGEALDASRIRSLPAHEVVDRVVTRLSQRAGAPPSGWRRLPGCGRQVYLVQAFRAACANYRLTDQVLAIRAVPGAPELAETAAAFQAIGLDDLAEILLELAARTDAVPAASDAMETTRPLPPDPFADLEKRVRAILATSRVDAALVGYIRAQAEALADP